MSSNLVNRPNKRFNNTDYNFCVSVYCANVVNHQAQDYITDLVMPLMEHCYIPENKPNVIQIVTYSRDKFEKVLSILNERKTQKNSPMAYFASPMNFETAEHAVRYQFTEYRTVDQIINDRKFDVSCNFSSAFTSQDIKEVVKKVCRRSNITYDENRLEIDRKVSPYRTNDHFFIVNYKVLNENELQNITKTVVCCCGSGNSKLTWKRFISTADYLKRNNKGDNPNPLQQLNVNHTEFDINQLNRTITEIQANNKALEDSLSHSQSKISKILERLDSVEERLDDIEEYIRQSSHRV